jgi:hypothetical protein
MGGGAVEGDTVSVWSDVLLKIGETIAIIGLLMMFVSYLLLIWSGKL